MLFAIVGSFGLHNFHALLGVQQGFRHELATNYAFLKVVIIDAHTV